MIMKCMALIVIGIPFWGKTFSKDEPLSKLVIKSNRAFTTPLKNTPGFYLVRYEQDVELELADKTKFSAQTLDIVVAKSALEKKRESEGLQKAAVEEKVKSVVMSGDVKIHRAHQVIKADKVELLVAKKQCIAQGNVHMSQKRNKKNDIPVQIASERAIVDLKSEKLLLVGTEKAPVSTTIEFSNKSSLSKSKNIKT